MDKAEEQKSSSNTSGQVYNPKKIPTYLGIFAENNITKDIKQYVKSGLELLRQKFPNDQEIANGLENFDSNKPPLTPIPDPHVTSLFIGGNHQVTSTEYFTTFPEGFKMDVEICAMAIVPGKIATGICFPDQSKVKLQNEFPHVTLMKGGWQPKQSNDLLEALCGKQGPLHEAWKSRELEKLEDGFAERFEIQGKQKFVAYVVRPFKFVMKSVARGSG